jgi:ubiquinone/menaquinone biosynthesis C-methylase UbiE
MTGNNPSGTKGSKVKESNKKNKNARLSRPQWQIPPGLTPGNFDYVSSSSIASDYDEFLHGNRLHAIDGQVLDRYHPALDVSPPQAKVVADFGCGNGRSLLPLLKKGYTGIGIDLSRPMLDACLAKAKKATLSQRLNLFACNLVELDAFDSESIDAAVCMFSTLGMIHGRKHRQTFLGHVRRMLKPRGRFVLHAHNAVFQVRQAGGLFWAAKSLWRSWRGRQEFGDRTATYRGVNNMFIHSFRRKELTRDLKLAGFTVDRWIGIPPVEGKFDLDAPLPALSDFRLVGWTVICS